MCETILIQKNRTEDGSMWIWGPGLFRVIGLSESQMQVSTVVLTNQFGTSTIQTPNVANVRLERVKRMKYWTTMACHVYDSRYCVEHCVL